MIFNSLTFFYFFIILLVANYAIPIHRRNLWILICSILFYMSWNPAFILLLFITALIDYYLAIQIAKSTDLLKRKTLLFLSLAFSLGSLGYFKYASMILETSQSALNWLGIAKNIPIWQITLPLGISFYTFETISYTVDVYRGTLKPKQSFFDYFFFLMFFPKLIAGPIVRASELLDQVPLPRKVDPTKLHLACNLLLWGFTKKILFADNIAPFVEKIFAQPGTWNRWMCISAIYGYSMQVYLDFSAYTDIARACAQLVGIELPHNFNRPYLAVSISDFWRRWHMTLSRWLRDYLFIPLGGSKGSSILTYRNLMITMCLGGLWHGANWTFLFWGFLNGSFLVIEKIYYDLKGTKPPHESVKSPFEHVLRVIVVFHLITFTRIFFRSQDFHSALVMIQNLIHPTTSPLEHSLALYSIPTFSIMYVLASGQKHKIMNLRPQGWYCLIYGIWLFTLLAFAANNAEFIYFQF